MTLPSLAVQVVNEAPVGRQHVPVRNHVREFAAIIQRNGGQVAGLLAALRAES